MSDKFPEVIYLQQHGGDIDESFTGEKIWRIAFFSVSNKNDFLSLSVANDKTIDDRINQ